MTPLPPALSPDQRAARRDALFRESVRARAGRVLLGSARALMPANWPDLPRLVRYWLDARDFPDAAAAPADRAGFCGIVRDLSPEAILEGYRRGLHPAGHAGPAKWWSPPAHCVLAFPEFHVQRRLRARLRQGRYRVTFDRDFEGVIKGCAAPRPGRWPVTWITPELMRAYAALFDRGDAHSWEVWNESGDLAGGGYGVALGGLFVIESQFSRENQASKFGFCMLNWHLARWGFGMNSNKNPAQNVLEMGFKTIPRAAYLARLPALLAMPGRPGRWQVETDLSTVAAWEPAAGHATNAAAAQEAGKAA